LVASHIAHDCVLGDDIIMSNNATLAGHVHVEDKAIIGGLTAVLQFCRIGKGAMIGGMCGIGQDVIPYGIVMGGYRAPLEGLNLVGLRRAGVESKLIFNLQKAYEDLFLPSEKNFAERVAALAENEAYKDNPLVQDVIRFVQNPSKYNILQPKMGA
jgi:UDP-N-acetylglucosamine acyltransferase